ncbi:hypothetical protein JHK82_026251 [Glycine max]|nr:hypothetical protein JHK85_026870 [Glycine max]KAG5135063.1 hypothetical protein JHK82_026251 [Glycine max]
MLLKDVRSARRIFLLMERDEPFDAKLEKMMRELNSINELFMRVKKKEEELLDILAEVDEHLHKLDRKRLEDMTEQVHSDPSSSQHKNEELLDQHKNLIPEGYCDMLEPQSSYLNFGSKWLPERKDLLVLQLGRWQDLPSHHIEVGNEEFLKELRDHNRLKYLNLRGISRIYELSPSIAKLESLEIP